jgi:type III pantothenate kinase
MPDRDARRVLAVDIGSTRMHVGLVAACRRKPTCLFRTDFPLSEMAERLPKALVKLKFSVPAVIAGGRKGHAKKAGDILKKRGVTSIAEIRPVPGLPVRFRYDRPKTLGADRIADALYAAAVYPKRNVVIIDAGTAITVDAVNNRAEFIGGAIFAGIGTQLCALHEAASALPLLTIPAGKILLPGRSTKQCLRAGAAHGTAGALNHLVKKYKSFLGGNCIVLATGGAWHLSKKLVDFRFIEAPDMTLIGTALYALYRKH